MIGRIDMLSCQPVPLPRLPNANTALERLRPYFLKELSERLCKMNSLRSRVYSAPVPKMPPGLVQLMEGLSEDVLRNKPSNIYEFCADHMHKLLQIRNDTQRKKSNCLQEKISKAQAIVRERAKQRRKYFENNFVETQPAYYDVNNDTEDSSVSKSEIVPDNLTPQQLFSNNESSPNVVADEHCNDRLEKVYSKEIGNNEPIHECMREKAESPAAQNTSVNAGVFDEKISLTDVKIPNNSTSLNSKEYSPSSVIIETIDFEPTIPKEKSDDGYGEAREGNFESIIDSSEKADEIRVCGEQDSTSSAGVTHHQMDLETAAITIQKVFRNFLFKSKTASLDDATNVDINLFIAENNMKNDMNVSNKERRGISRMDTVLQTVNEEKSLSLSTDDSSTLSSAATIIQAHIRGFLVRNKLNVDKTPTSVESMIDSREFSCTSLDINNDPQKTKTVLNIHIVPETDNFASRDESLINSMDLSMDDSPHLTSSHASYDITERRKQLKREDAIQSVTPPSNASTSKLSEDMDSVRELVARDNVDESSTNSSSGNLIQNLNQSTAVANEVQTAVETENDSFQRSLEKADALEQGGCGSPLNIDSNILNDERSSDSLEHSSEFHEVVIPTKVTRSDTSVVREFHNVLAYFLLWDYTETAAY